LRDEAYQWINPASTLDAGRGVSGMGGEGREGISVFFSFFLILAQNERLGEKKLYYFFLIKETKRQVKTTMTKYKQLTKDNVPGRKMGQRSHSRLVAWHSSQVLS
jgi:hypothetical protein